jgi:hypothetical protein
VYVVCPLRVSHFVGEQFWFKNINSENAAAIMQVSDHYNAHQLKQFALQYIFEHVKEVVATTAWKVLQVLMYLTLP